jgi:hypothetical protein
MGTLMGKLNCGLNSNFMYDLSMSYNKEWEPGWDIGQISLPGLKDDNMEILFSD